MKNSILGLISLFCLLQYGCDGGFEKADFAINLEYPEPNSSCEEGIANGNLLTIPFKWKPQGDLMSFTLVLNDSQISISDFTIDDDGFYNFDYDVNFNEDYVWQIVSENIESDSRTFRTPIVEENNNNVPLAVKFGNLTYNGDNNSMDVTFTWEGGDSDNDGNLKYDAYWSPNEDVSTSNNSGEETNLTSPTVTFTILNFDSDRDYYILVVAKDGENSASSILKFRQF